MSSHGRAAWDYIPNPPRQSPFVGGSWGGGGGGLAVVVCTHPCGGGGLPVGASPGLAEKYPVASPGLVGPFEEEPRIRGGGLRYMVWYGMVWYGMVWYGMVWYGMVCCCCCCCCDGTQHVPAGEIARHALPGQGAREQSPGVTLAGRVPTTTEGGGGSAFCLGGKGARVAVRGTTCPCDPGSLPRRGGGACAPVRNGGGTGGGMEGPPVRGPAGPRFPLLPAATPPRQGRGLRPVRGWSKGVEGAGTMYGLLFGARPLCPVCGRPRGTAGGGVQAWAGRVGSGGRPRRRRRHAGAGPVAVAGRCGRTGRRPAVAMRVPLLGVGGRAGGTRAAQARPWGAHVQGRRRARCGPRCGPRDQRQGRSVAWGPRAGPGAWQLAWVAAGGRGGSGAMRVRGPCRPRGGAGGPAGGRRRP